MEPVFDTPMWKFQIPPEGTEDSIVVMTVGCYSLGDEFRGEARVVVPSEMFVYFKELYKLEDLDNLELDMTQEGGRYYLSYALQEDYGVDLWYYTENNLPLWARRVYGV